MSYFWSQDLEWFTLCLKLHLATIRSRAEQLQDSLLNENKTRHSNNIEWNRNKVDLKKHERHERRTVAITDVPQL